MSGNGYLTAEELLSCATRRYLEFRLPEELPAVGGRRIRLRSLTEAEQSAYEMEILTKKGGVRRQRLGDAKRRLIVATVVDAQGKPLFSRADVDRLAEIDGQIVELIAKEAQKHIGIDELDVETLVKNSERIPSADSSTASPSRSGSSTSTKSPAA